MRRRRCSLGPASVSASASSAATSTSCGVDEQHPQPVGEDRIVDRRRSVAPTATRLTKSRRTRPGMSMRCRSTASASRMSCHAAPSAPTRSLTGTRTSSRNTSLSAWPSMVGIGRIVTPGACRSRMSRVRPRSAPSASAGPAQQPQVVGVVGVRRPAFLAVDHVRVAVAAGSGAHRTEVRARLRFGVAEREADLAATDARQIALLLLVGAVHDQRLSHDAGPEVRASGAGEGQFVPEDEFVWLGEPGSAQALGPGQREPARARRGPGRTRGWRRRGRGRTAGDRVPACSRRGIARTSARNASCSGVNCQVTSVRSGGPARRPFLGEGTRALAEVGMGPVALRDRPRVLEPGLAGHADRLPRWPVWIR